MGKKTYKSALMNEVVDERTGEVIRQAVVTEVIPGFIDLKVAQKGRFNNGEFITIFQNTMFRIATQGNLTKNELVLLLYLLGTAGLDNSICTDLGILSGDLNMDKGNISRSIKGLVKRNIVIRRDGQKVIGQRTLPMELSLNYDQLNYDLSYKGRVKDYSKIKGIHPEIEPCPQKSLPKTDPNQLKFDFFGEENNEIDPDILETIKEENEKLDKLHKERKRLIDRLNELKDKNMEWAGENFYIDEFGNPSFRGKSPYEKEIREINKKLENFLN